MFSGTLSLIKFHVNACTYIGNFMICNAHYFFSHHISKCTVGRSVIAVHCLYAWCRQNWNGFRTLRNLNYLFLNLLTRMGWEQQLVYIMSTNRMWRRWKKQENELINCERTRKNFRGREHFYSELEEYLEAFVTELRDWPEIWLF